MNEELEKIGLQMIRVLPRSWVYEVMTWAESREAFRLYLMMWRDAQDDAERADIVVDLQALLDDRHKSPDSAPVASKADFDQVYEERRALKAHLRRLIEARGGVSEVARQADMPQPSLSRLLNSAAAPRGATLARLAAAMGVSVSRLYPQPDEGGAEVVPISAAYRARHIGQGAVTYRIGIGSTG